LQAPIVIADRIQCFVDLQVTSARTLREREDDVARHYIAERRVRDGDLGARAAFASLIELIGRLGLQHPFIVLEGGSISLLSLLSQMHRSGNLPFRMSLDMMTMGDEAAHRKRLAARARQMLAPPSGAPGHGKTRRRGRSWQASTALRPSSNGATGELWTRSTWFSENCRLQFSTNWWML
jgi:hypothetical protein